MLKNIISFGTLHNAIYQKNNSQHYRRRPTYTKQIIYSQVAKIWRNVVSNLGFKKLFGLVRSQ
jgi:hypothetical protein